MNTPFLGLVIYLVIIALVAVWTFGMNKTKEAFILGSRRLGAWVIAFSERTAAESSWLILGLSVFFRTYLAAPGRWLGRLDENVYGVYVIHVFVLVGLQSAIVDIALPALTKFAIVTVVGLIMSFGLAAALRRIPGVARVV